MPAPRSICHRLACRPHVKGRVNRTTRRRLPGPRATLVRLPSPDDARPALVCSGVLLNLPHLRARSIAFGTLISAVSKGMPKPTANRQTCWNFGDSRSISLSLDEFLAQKEADGVEFFVGKEPWLKGLDKLNWQTFFRVCTQEMDG